MIISRKEIRLSDSKKYSVNTFMFFEIGKYCFCKNEKTKKCYAFKNFDLQTLKMMTFEQIDALKSVNVRSITVSYQLSKHNYTYIRIRFNDFFNHIEPINNRVKTNLIFTINDNYLKDFYSKILTA